jgi:exopolyphosphatase/guanosine-5'-triphosphate,3'-diphosphate pyrophosphatase
MNIASIDIGTNTVLALFAEINSGKSIKTIRNEYRMPRIGKGLKPGLPISEDKIAELMKILEEYSMIAKELNCEKILAAGTNAFRIASNASEVRTIIKSKFGIDVNIVQGKDEAYLSYLGAVYPEYADSENLVIDIGGGSTEIIFGKGSDISYSKSFQIGVVSLTEKFFFNRPPSFIEIKQAENEINSVFNELRHIDKSPVKSIAVAGTPTSLSCIKQNIQNYSEDKVEGSLLYEEDLNESIKVFSTKHPDELLALYPEILKGREDVMLAGTLILKNLIRILKLNEITVSAKGIRYGIIADYILKQK